MLTLFVWSPFGALPGDHVLSFYAVLGENRLPAVRAAQWSLGREAADVSGLCPRRLLQFRLKERGEAATLSRAQAAARLGAILTAA
jgi:hypothetical protein